MAYTEILVVAAIVFYVVYKWSVSKFDTFHLRGIPHEPGKPFLGNLSLDIFFRKSSLLKRLVEFNDKFKNCKVYGFYNATTPTFVVRDAELLRKITVKEFDHFTNRAPTLTVDVEPLIGKSLLSLQDIKWKDMRTALSPTFTGSKMRQMYELINNCTDEAIKKIYAMQQCNSKDATADIEMKDFCGRFANDVIASAAFGIKVNSFEDKQNEFLAIGNDLTDFSGLRSLKILLFTVIPKIMKSFNQRLLDQKKVKYFSSLVFDAMQYRKENNIIRPDMIHLLMEAQRDYHENKKEVGDEHNEFSDTDLLAQCLLFFFAGFDTVSTCLSFTTYELLMNPIEQEKLYAEIVAMERELNGKTIDYDALMKMKYLDMVISESLRKWPPAIALVRICNADAKLLDDNGEFVVEFRKGDSILISAIGMHLDPENFTDPMRFDPERFSDERKHEIKPFTYMPFGLGPRSCIGNRFALMEVKSIIYHLVLNFKLMPTEKTCKDMFNNLSGFQMLPKQGFWTKLVPRNKS